MKHSKFVKYSWGVLIVNIFVILWGAIVRATGSGAGCGSHWPSCNGEVIPQAPQVETIIEFIHRLTSGIALLLVVGMLIDSLRKYPKGEPVRKSAGWAMAFMVSEALVGAGLVLFEWVAGNISVARVIVMSIHLLNTHMLLGAILLTAWFAAGNAALSLKGQPARLKWMLGIGILGVLILSMAGAVTALGDTLFPADTLAEGIQQDFSAASHFIVRLRVWHPVIAIAVGLYLFYTVGPMSKLSADPRAGKIALIVRILFGVQLAAGMINLLLLAPVWMQIVHLLLADLVWLALVLLGVVIMTEPKGESYG